MIGSISEALIRRMPDRISETAPGRTPIAVARPPLDLPVFSSPRSIILTSSMASSFPVPKFRNFGIIQFRLSEIKLDFYFGISEIRATRQQPSPSSRAGTRRARPAWIASAALRLAMTQSLGEESGCNQTGRRNIQRRCANTSPRACPFRRSPRRSTRNSTTDYSRNATIGRARRMGLAGTDRPNDAAKVRLRIRPSRSLHRAVERHVPEARRPVPVSAEGGGTAAPLCRHRAAPSFAAGSRAGRLPLSLWRRRGGRSHHLLRPRPPRGFELLRFAFSPDARARHGVGARRRAGLAATGGGGMNSSRCDRGGAGCLIATQRARPPEA